ncbi:hypothetical protein M885DRAFT_512333 [Pelagophyceae sp. CCMP2097]|nr:hypothetical protein M885DRAFT_512333 [Pelagophyceae sp. CCMP2097]
MRRALTGLTPKGRSAGRSAADLRRAALTTTTRPRRAPQQLTQAALQASEAAEAVVPLPTPLPAPLPAPPARQRGSRLSHRVEEPDLAAVHCVECHSAAQANWMLDAILRRTVVAVRRAGAAHRAPDAAGGADADAAARVIEGIGPKHADFDSFMIALRICQLRRQVDAAERVAAELAAHESLHSDPTLWEVAMIAAAEDRDEESWVRCTRLVQMSRGAVSSRGLRMAIIACGQNWRFHEAIEVADEAWSRTGKKMEDVSDLRRLLRSFMWKANPFPPEDRCADLADLVLRHFELHGVPIDAQMYHRAMQANEAIGQWPEVLRLWEIMHSAPVVADASHARGSAAVMRGAAHPAAAPSAGFQVGEGRILALQAAQRCLRPRDDGACSISFISSLQRLGRWGESHGALKAAAVAQRGAFGLSLQLFADAQVALENSEEFLSPVDALHIAMECVVVLAREVRRASHPLHRKKMPDGSALHFEVRLYCDEFEDAVFQHAAELGLRVRRAEAERTFIFEAQPATVAPLAVPPLKGEPDPKRIEHNPNYKPHSAFRPAPEASGPALTPLLNPEDVLQSKYPDSVLMPLASCAWVQLYHSLSHIAGPESAVLARECLALTGDRYFVDGHTKLDSLFVAAISNAGRDRDFEKAESLHVLLSDLKVAPMSVTGALLDARCRAARKALAAALYQATSGRERDDLMRDHDFLLQSAMDLFNYVAEPSEACYSMIVRALARAPNCHKAAVELHEEARDKQIKLSQYATLDVCAALTRLDLIDPAIVIARSSAEELDRVDDETLRLIYLDIRVHEVDAHKERDRHRAGAPMPETDLSRELKHACEAGDSRAALDLVIDALQAATAAQAEAAQEDPDDEQDYEMPQVPLRTDFEHVLMACERDGRWADSLDILGLMRRWAPHLERGPRTPRPENPHAQSPF